MQEALADGEAEAAWHAKHESLEAELASIRAGHEQQIAAAAAEAQAAAEVATTERMRLAAELELARTELAACRETSDRERLENITASREQVQAGAETALAALAEELAREREMVVALRAELEQLRQGLESRGSTSVTSSVGRPQPPSRASRHRHCFPLPIDPASLATL